MEKNVTAGKHEALIVNKPWGHEVIFAHTYSYVGKLLFIKANHQLSLQYHEHKEETIHVLSGKVEVITPTDSYMLYPGDTFHVPPTFVHRFKGIQDSTLVEVSTPHLQDLVRISDDYGRDANQ